MLTYGSDCTSTQIHNHHRHRHHDRDMLYDVWMYITYNTVDKLTQHTQMFICISEWHDKYIMVTSPLRDTEDQCVCLIINVQPSSDVNYVTTNHLSI